MENKNVKIIKITVAASVKLILASWFAARQFTL